MFEVDMRCIAADFVAFKDFFKKIVSDYDIKIL